MIIESTMFMIIDSVVMNILVGWWLWVMVWVLVLV